MPASDEVGIPPDLIEASDADLIGRAAQGDARALEVLYERYSGVVFSCALRIVADRPLGRRFCKRRSFAPGSREATSAPVEAFHHLAAEHHAQLIDRRDSTATATATEGGQRSPNRCSPRYPTRGRVRMLRMKSGSERCAKRLAKRWRSCRRRSGKRSRWRISGE